MVNEQIYSQCSSCSNSIGTNQYSVTTTSSLANTTTLTGTWCLFGTLIIDNTFQFTALTLRMSTDAKIQINNNKTLSINNSDLVSCDGTTMWDRISVGSNASIDMDGSTIEDAKVGIAAAGSTLPLLSIQNSVFNRNLTAISIGNSLNPSLSKFVNVNIVCETSIGSGAPANLLYPYSSIRSQYGVNLINTPFFNFSATAPDYTFHMFNVQ